MAPVAVTSANAIGTGCVKLAIEFLLRENNDKGKSVAVRRVIFVAAFTVPVPAGITTDKSENSVKKGFIQDIESIAIKNIEFRGVI